MLYIVVIAILVPLFSLFSYLVFEWEYLVALARTFGAVVAVVCIDGIVAGGSRLMPSKWFNHNAKAFTVSREEKNFYEKLNVRKWKDRIPEIGHFTGFRKNKLADPTSSEYVERFLLESCYGEVGHFLSCFFGFLLFVGCVFLPRGWWFTALLVSLVNVFMNLPSLFILRYNSFKLEILYKRNLRNEKKLAEQRAA